MSSQPITIMIVEDNPQDVVLIEASFQRTNSDAKLLSVGTGGEALEQLRDWQHDFPEPGLILLDLNLPDMKGHDFLREVRSDARLVRVPVIVLTGSQNEEDTRECYSLGANAYLNKPVNLEHFVSLVGLLDSFWLKLVALPNRAARQDGTSA